VEHVAVCGRDGTKLGTIERLMLDKVSGTVAYAVIKTGGLLGTHHHYRCSGARSNTSQAVRCSRSS
jgi:nitric oxide reductase large subunit